ncbi:hypothetical protein FJZ26_06105 [Candidatus Parvarchaeota archaeon]|nr:hypothetical protein [Candidatus Parvarchaeota archaeon]
MEGIKTQFQIAAQKIRLLILEYKRTKYANESIAADIWFATFMLACLIVFDALIIRGLILILILAINYFLYWSDKWSDKNGN